MQTALVIVAAASVENPFLTFALTVDKFVTHTCKRDQKLLKLVMLPTVAIENPCIAFALVVNEE